MNASKFVTLIAVSVLVAILLASALNSFTRVADNALAQVSPPLLDGGGQGGGSNAPRTLPRKNYLPIIFLNSATAGGAWLLSGNAGTNPTTDFLGTTDNMTLTLRVNNTVGWRLAPSGTNTPNVIGGYSGNNVAPGVYGATIAGGGGSGFPNVITVTAIYATIGGGAYNTAGNDYATVGGGYLNNASGFIATVGGGQSNNASGQYATVPGGAFNVASGDYSFAVGEGANTNGQTGAFVWADSIGSPLYATTANQFLVRASGGITLYTNSLATSGAALYPGSGSWNNLSNKNMKANFSAVDPRAILAQVNALPITTWNYTTQDASIRHIGPMAQDFSAAFKVGENDTTISTVDAQGVALAAIQGLYQVVQDKDAQIAAQQKQINDLDARLTAIEQANGLQSLNAFTVNNLPLWGIVGLLALLLVKRRK